MPYVSSVVSRLVSGFLLLVILMMPVMEAQAAMKKNVLPLLQPKLIVTPEVKVIQPQNNAEVAPVSSGGVVARSMMGGVDTPRFEETKVQKAVMPNVNELTGSFTYSLPIVVPPGRLGMQPLLALSYDSAHNDELSSVGFGWSLGVPVISRLNKIGSDRLFSQPIFSSSISGELVLKNDGSYGAKVENGDFLQYTIDGSRWVVIDKKGTTFIFGSVSSARLSDPADSSRIGVWYLSEIIDVHGNGVRYEYSVVQGFPYLTHVAYTTFVGSGDVGIFGVDMQYETLPVPRTSYTFGFVARHTQRVSRIQTTVNGSWVRRYDLSYSAGVGGRSLLSNVVESGHDETTGQVIVNPPYSFTYSTNDTGWEERGASALNPVLFTEYWRNVDEGWRVVELNGDGLPDMMQSYRYIEASDGTERYEKHVLLGQVGGGYVATDLWQIPDNAYFVYHYNGRDLGTRAVDVNGDGLTDLVVSKLLVRNGQDEVGQGDVRVYINDGVGSFALSSEWNTGSVYFVDSDNKSLGTRVADINGDGLPDLIRAQWMGYLADGVTPDSSKRWVYLNNGNGWMLDSSWTMEDIFFMDAYSRDQGDQIVDVNGDGLADVVHAIRYNVQNPDGTWQGEQRVYLNTGHGWHYDSSWLLPNDMFFWFYYSGMPDGFLPMDVNGDGLVDFVENAMNDAVSGLVEYRKLYVNTGHGWVLDTSFAWPSGVYFYNFRTAGDLGTRFYDVDSDGLSDIAIASDENGDLPDIRKWYRNTGKRPNVMTGVVVPMGGSVEVSYGAVTNSGMPFVMPVVSTVTANNGFGTVDTTTYIYEGGRYFATGGVAERQFAGFAKVTKVYADGVREVSLYHQGDATDSANGEYTDHIGKSGRPYRVTLFDASGAVMNELIRKWDRVVLDGGAGFVFLVREVNRVFEGGVSHRDSAVEYGYDVVNGNRISVVKYGEVVAGANGDYSDVIGDTVRFETSYAIPTVVSGVAARMLMFVSDERIFDGDGILVARTSSFYDGLLSGVGAVGDVTSVRKYIDAGSFVTSSQSYDVYGLVMSATDARGVVTSFGYDSTHLLPVSSTNVLGHLVSMTYDLSSGQKVRVVDAGGVPTETEYDALDRVLEERIVDPVQKGGVLVPVKRYTYLVGSLSSSVVMTTFASETASQDSATYVDGFGQTVQVRVVGVGGVAGVRDVVYGVRGLVARDTIVYPGNGLTRSAVSQDVRFAQTYSYDAAGRVVSMTNVVGTVATAYVPWGASVTDTNGHVKTMMRDAYGRLVSVHDGVWTTLYSYSALGLLTRVVDAEGGVRNFGFDMLGRRVRAEDVHSVGAVSGFGVWLYGYDAMGNQVSVTDPKGVVTSRTFDVLGRMVSEDATSTAVLDETRVYDSCVNGVGRLCSVTTPEVVTLQTYQLNGFVASVVKSFGRKKFTTSYGDYTRGGVALREFVADGSVVRHALNSVGQMFATFVSAGGVEMPVVASTLYTHDGRVAEVAYANGVVQNSVYDPEKLFRISDVRSVRVSDGAVLESRSYVFDAVGNMISMVEDGVVLSMSAGGSVTRQKTVTYGYDVLDRLVSAVTTMDGGDSVSDGWQYSATGRMVGRTADGVAVTMLNLKYDANGNVVGRDGAGGFSVAKYGYSYDNYLVSVVGASQVGYTYDGDGWNVMTNVSTVSTNTSAFGTSFGKTAMSGVGLMQGTARLPKPTLPGVTLITTYTPNVGYMVKSTGERQVTVWHGGLAVANLMWSAGTVAPVTRFTVYDHLGSPTVTTDVAGLVVGMQDFAAYGGVRFEGTGAVDTGVVVARGAQSFAGSRREDEVTGLVRMGGRWYMAEAGQFMTQDAVWLAMGDAGMVQGLTGSGMEMVLLEPVAVSKYGYARGNPVKWVDTSGDFAVLAAALASAVITVATYGPQIGTYLQSLTTPIGQMGVYNAVEDSKKRNYGWAVFGAVTAGEIPVRKFFPVFKGIWTIGKEESSALNAFGHAVKHGPEFDINNTRSYVQATRDFITKSINDGLQTKLQKANGYDILRTYDKNSNTFSAFEVREGGVITPRSMFKPGLKQGYFDSQPGQLIDIKNYFSN